MNNVLLIYLMTIILFIYLATIIKEHYSTRYFTQTENNDVTDNKYIYRPIETINDPNWANVFSINPIKYKELRRRPEPMKPYEIKSSKIPCKSPCNVHHDCVRADHDCTWCDPKRKKCKKEPNCGSRCTDDNDCLGDHNCGICISNKCQKRPSCGTPCDTDKFCVISLDKCIICHNKSKKCSPILETHGHGKAKDLSQLDSEIRLKSVDICNIRYFNPVSNVVDRKNLCDVDWELDMLNKNMIYDISLVGPN